MTASTHSARSAAQASGKGAGVLLTAELQRGFRADALVLFERFLNAADDRLFEYAERAGGDSRFGYLQAMRRLRSERVAMGERFRAVLDTQLQSGWRSHAVAGQALELIDDRVVEERLALQATSLRLDNHCGAALLDFKQRLEDGRRRLGLELLDLQFAPATLCTALVEGLRGIEADLDLTVVLLKLFEQTGRERLDAVYRRLGALLQAHGLQGEAAPAVEQAEAPAKPAPVSSGVDATLAIRAIAANAEALAALLRRPAASGAAGRLDPQLDVAPQARQGGEAQGWPQAVLLRAAASSWLFDEILGDVNVPAGLRGELEALRGPIARAALLEDGFIRDTTHPLRKLVHDVATLAATARIAPPRQASVIRDFITEMGFTVERGLPQGDLRAAPAIDEQTVRLFSEATREAGSRRRAALARRASETATAAIDRVAERHLGDAALPDSVSRVLEKVFGPLLGLVLLRHGNASPAFRQGEALLDEFLAAVAQGAPAASPVRPLAERVARAAAGAGLSAAYQGGIPAQLDQAIACGPLATAQAAAAGDIWSLVPGLEVGEISSADIEACATGLFEPGSWFRVDTADHGGAARWMQVERCDVATGQVRFVDAFGRNAVARPLQKLVFEVLSGQCEYIGCSAQCERLMAKLTHTLRITAPVAV